MANINLSGSISTTGTSILGSFNVVFASDDADHVLTVTEYTNNFLNVTSGVSLTATRNLIGPLVAGQSFVIQNNTTGGQSITIKGVTGTGFTIANGTTASVICDGTNYLQTGGAPVGVFYASTFGAKGDNVVDDTAALQRMLDSTNVSGFQGECVLDSQTITSVHGTSAVWYKCTSPLFLNDQIGKTQVLQGLAGGSTGLAFSGFTGPCLVDGYLGEQPPYVQDGYSMWCLPSSPALPLTINASQYDTGSINGLSALTIEFWYNPHISFAPPGHRLVLASSYGNLGLETSTGFVVERYHFGGTEQWLIQLNTSNGLITMFCTPGVGLPTANALNHIAVTYDGAHLRLFVNGVQPDSTFTVSATGTVKQAWYEELTFCNGQYFWFPSAGGAVENVSLPVTLTGTVASVSGTALIGSGTTFTSQVHVGDSLTLGSDTAPFLVASVTNDTHLTLQSTYTGSATDGAAIVDVPIVLFGKIRVSTNARYTSNFTPDPTYAVDANTKLFVDFNPANTSSRANQKDWIIGQSAISGPKATRSSSGSPVWLRTGYTGFFYVTTKLSNLLIDGSGTGLYMHSSSGSSYNTLGFQNLEQGIISTDYSYGNTFDTCTFFEMAGGFTGNSYNMVFGNGNQFCNVINSASIFGASGWHIVCSFGDITISGAGQINSFEHGIILLTEVCSSCNIIGISYTDENSPLDECGLYAANCNSLQWNGGFIAQTASSAPVFKIGNANSCLLNMSIFSLYSQPVISFGSSVSSINVARNIPIIFSGINTGDGFAIPELVDPAHPGPVIVPQLTQYPHFIADLLTYPPANLPIRAVIQLDGYAAVGDGGEGTFYWNAGYTGPSTPLTVIPTGATVGAWCREIGTDNVITAAMFGAKGDCVEDLTKINGLAGTDDTAALQSMLDYNNLYLQDGYDVRQYVCKLPATQYQFNSRLTAPRTTYRLSSPLQINDYTAQGNGSTVGNTTQQLLGEPGARSGLIAVDYQGPAVVCGNYGAHPPTYIPDPNGSGETLCPIGLSVPTTIAAGSDGQVLPQAIIHVADTSAFPTAGLIYIVASNGFQSAAVNYTGSTSTTFTGCTLVAGYTAITLNTGDRVSAYVFSPPSWNLSEYSLGDLQGWTNFTFECFVNPGNSNAWADTHSPAGFISSFFGCAGTLGGPGGLDTTTAVRYHLTFQLQQYNVFGPQALAFQVQTANGSYTVGTSTSVDHTWTANTLNHFAVSYDGAHLRMFINGAQPDSSMTVAATGALVQQWYESMTLATGGNINFPVFGNGGLFNSAAPGFLLGKTRLSNTARYTAPFTPPLPSAVVCDANTRFYLDFVSSIPSRPGLQCYSIAQSGEGRWGRMLPDGYGFPVWLKTWTNSTQYTSNARVKSLYFQSAGRGIDLESSLNSVVGEDCFFLSCEQGIVFDNFSYNSGVGPNCAHALSGASTSSNCMSAEIIFGPGSQFAYVEDGWSSQTGGANWGLIQVFTDVKIGNTFLTTYVQGTYCFVQNSTTVLLDGSSLQDGGADGGTFDLCGILFAPSDIDAVLTWQGGYGGLSNNVPMIIIGNSGASVTVNTSVFGLTTGPIFSFQGRLAASTTTPAIFPGGNPEGMLVIDPAHPGPVIVPQQQLATTGVNVLTFGADPTGVNDSYNAFVNAIKFASSLSVPLFVPYGTYNISRYIAIENEITIEGAISSNGFSGATQQPTIEGFIYGGNAAQPFWGGTWMGPLFTVVAPGVAADSPVGYTHNHGIYKAQVGGINGVNNYPIMFLSETGCSSLNGLAAMTVEYAFNFHTMDASNATPWCGGAMSDFSPFTTTFQVYTIGGPTNYGLHATLTTTNGVFDCATSPTALTINTDYCAAVTYDGTNLKLFAGPPGGSPIVTATVAADGYVVQNPWEDFIMGASGGGITDSCTWPLGWGNLTDPMEWGNFRLSNIARTITTMPATEFLVGDRDANTLLMISFDPAYRTGLGGIVATTHDPAFCGYILAGPGSCYLQWRNIIATVGQGVRCDFKNLVLSGYEGITTEFANFVNTYNLSFATRKGITRVNNSYYYEDINPKFDTSSFNAGNASHNWGIASLDTAGLGKIEGANFTSQDGSNASLVLNGASNMIIRDFFINTVNGWVGIFASGSGDLLFDNVGMGSENGTPNVIQAMAIFNDNTNVNWNGGGLYPLTDCLRQCNILIDKGAGNVGPAGTGGQYRFNLDLAGHSTYITSHFSCPPGHNPTFPIILESSYQGRGIEGVYPWSDGYANVVVQPLETNGRSVYATTSSAAITCQWMTPQPGTVGSGPDFSCGTLVITDTGNFLTGTTVVNPPPNFAFAGYTRTVVAPSTHAIIFGGVTIQPSQSVTLESNGTSNWSIVAEFPITTNVANYLVTQLSTTTGIIGATILIDGYAAANDGGQGFYSWNPTYTGVANPINIYPNGGTTGAWQRLLTSPLLSVLYFGAKGDGVTDDTRAIQATINAMYPTASGTLYFPAISTTGTTNYLTTQPLFLGGGTTASGIGVTMDLNTQLVPSGTWTGPAIVSSFQFDQPTFGTQVPVGGSSPVTYVELGADQNFNLNYTPASNLNNWGDGYVTFTTANFTVPNIGTSVTVAVVSSANYTPTALGGRAVYVQGGGLYFATIVDPTHLSLNYVGPIAPFDVATSATVNAGAGISGVSSSPYTGPTPGFTFECFVDPVSDLSPGAISFLVSSSGNIGSQPNTSAFGLNFYNDQGTPQTRLTGTITTTAGLTTLAGGSHTLTAGQLVHVALVYDGISTASLYIGGTRAATATTSGPMVQNWWELVLLGCLSAGYPGIGQIYASLPTHIAGVALFPFAKYRGTSFSPPTTIPIYVNRMACSIIDFAQQPTVIGPLGVNYGTGWIIATTPNLVASVAGTPTWLQNPIGNGLTYCQGPLMTNVTINMNASGAHMGDGIYAWNSLNAIYDNVSIQGGTRGITLDNFSYRNRLSNMNITTGLAGYGDFGINQYSWCAGIIGGSQYCNVDGGYYSGAAWQIVNNVYAGIGIKGPMWFETTGIGGILLNAGGGPAAAIEDVFFQSDLGQSGLTGLCSIFVANVANLVIKGGYLGATFENISPQLIVDSCENVHLDGAWIAPNLTAQLIANGSSPLVKLFNQTTPVMLHTSVQGYSNLPAGGTFHVINGSSNVAVSVPGNFTIGFYAVFSSQPNTAYRVLVVDPITGALTLHVPYSGTTTTAATCVNNGLSWMPEDGYTGQGPLYIVHQEEFGVHTVNMIASTGMTLLINDFLWGVIRFTDDDSLLSGTVKVTLPLIAGYSRRMINTTTQSLTLGGVTGSTVTLTSNSATTIACDGTNWFLA